MQQEYEIQGPGYACDNRQCNETLGDFATVNVDTQQKYCAPSCAMKAHKQGLRKHTLVGRQPFRVRPNLKSIDVRRLPSHDENLESSL